MKKAVYPLACLVLVLLFAGVSGGALLIANTNGTEGGAVAPAAPYCWVSNTPAGGAVYSVSESGYSVENMYWASYSPGRTLYNLEFDIIFYGHGPATQLKRIIIKFKFPAGWGGTTTTPFGVPFWGGDPILGRAVVVPKISGVMRWSEAFYFTVVK